MHSVHTGKSLYKEAKVCVLPLKAMNSHVVTEQADYGCFRDMALFIYVSAEQHKWLN
jgi:hypothetical protein